MFAGRRKGFLTNLRLFELESKVSFTSSLSWRGRMGVFDFKDGTLDGGERNTYIAVPGVAMVSTFRKVEGFR
jgi:hypothetical protein